ncbi:MAG: dockerin type I domain-containing protein [Patescibacteria group bacterium]
MKYTAKALVIIGLVASPLMLMAAGPSRPLVSAVDLTATIKVWHEDNFSQPEKSKFFYQLIIDGVKSATLDFYPTQPLGVRSGARVAVRGWQLGRTVFTDTTVAGNFRVVADAPVSPATGEHKSLVLLVDFTNPNSRPYTREQVETTLFSGDFQKYFAENSYDQLSFRGDVFGWYHMDSLANYLANPCRYSLNLINDLQFGQLLSTDGINPDNYREILILPYHRSGGFHGCSSVGPVPNKPYSVSSMGLTDATTLVGQIGIINHEIGHALGLAHANAIACAGGTTVGPCEFYEYGNPYDTMGFTNRGHFNAAEKDYLGWVDEDRQLIISKSGTYTINNLEQSAGIKFAKIKIGNEHPYYLEYRRDYGFDAHVWFDSILGGGAHSNNFQGLTINHSFTDSRGNFWFSRLLDLRPNVPTYGSSDMKISSLVAGEMVDEARGVAVGPIVSQDNNSITFKVSFAQSDPLTLVLPDTHIVASPDLPVIIEWVSDPVLIPASTLMTIKLVNTVAGGPDFVFFSAAANDGRELVNLSTNQISGGVYRWGVSAIGTDGQFYGDESEALLTVNAAPPPPPSLGPVLVATEPNTEVVDARLPLDAAGGVAGNKQITLIFSDNVSGKLTGDFEISLAGTERYDLTGVFYDPSDSKRITLALDRPLVPGYGTAIRPKWGGSVACLRYLPGDVNGDGRVSQLDQMALIDHLNGVEGKERPLVSVDIDRSGTVTPKDIIALVDIFNGAGRAAPSPWLGRELVGCP